MHRKYIRATVASADVDIPIDVFVDGQWLKYQDGKIISSPLVLPSGNVIGENPVTDNAVVRWNGVSGTVIQNSVVIIGDTGAVTGVLTIDGRDPLKWVDGPTPAVSTNNNLAVWNGTTGRLIKDSTVDVDSVLYNDNRPVVDGRIVVFNGTSGTNTSSSIYSPGDFVKGPNVGGNPAGTTTTNAVALWTNANGRDIKNSVVTIDSTGNITTPGDMTPSTVGGVPVGLLVKSSGSTPHPNNVITRWSNATGHPLKDSTVTLDDTGNLTGLGTLNTRTIANWVDGPASAVNNNIVVFNGTSGKAVSDSGLRLVDTVRCTFVSTDNAVVRWDGTTGNTVQDSVVVISDIGAVTGVNSLNGVQPSAWVQGPAAGGSTDNTLAVWDGTTGRFLKNGGATSVTVDPGTGVITTPVGVLVHSTAAVTHTDNAVVRFDGTGYKTQDSVVIIDDSGNISGAGTLNTRTIANWVESTSTFPTVDRLLAVSTAGTRRIQPTGLIAADLVTAAANFSTDNLLLRSDGTTKAAQASTVTLDDSGNLTGVGTINGLGVPGIHCERYTLSNTHVYTFPLSGEWTVVTYIGYTSVTGSMTVTVSQSGAGFNNAYVWVAAQGNRITSSGGTAVITNSGIPATGVIQVLTSSIPSAPGDTLTISITNCFVTAFTSNGLKI